jgi:hypothetical protein
VAGLQHDPGGCSGFFASEGWKSDRDREGFQFVKTQRDLADPVSLDGAMALHLATDCLQTWDVKNQALAFCSRGSSEWTCTAPMFDMHSRV